MQYNLLKTPPSKKEIEEREEEVRAELITLQKRKRRIMTFLEVFLPLIFLSFPMLWIMGVMSSKPAVFVAAITVISIWTLRRILIWFSVAQSVIDVFGSVYVFSLIGLVFGFSYTGLFFYVCLISFAISICILETVYRHKITFPLDIARAKAGACQKILSVHCADVVGWCLRDDVIAKYQNAVCAQGRDITEGEYLAMKKWIAPEDNRTSWGMTHLKMQAACEALRVPIRPTIN